MSIRKGVVMRVPWSNLLCTGVPVPAWLRAAGNVIHDGSLRRLWSSGATAVTGRDSGRVGVTGRAPNEAKSLRAAERTAYEPTHVVDEERTSAAPDPV